MLAKIDGSKTLVNRGAEYLRRLGLLFTAANTENRQPWICGSILSF